MVWILIILAIRKILKRFFPETYIRLLQKGFFVRLRQFGERNAHRLPEKYAIKLNLISSEESNKGCYNP